MIDDDLKSVTLIILLALAVIAVYPILNEGRVVEPFSELGVLGANGKIGDYPRQLVSGQNFNLTLYVGNHEGRVEYYRVVAKLSDETSNVSDVSPLDAQVKASWETIISSGSNSTIPVRLSVGSAGLNRRLVFELWRYDVASHDFVYDERWTQLWYNVTATG